MTTVASNYGKQLIGTTATTWARELTAVGLEAGLSQVSDGAKAAATIGFVASLLLATLTNTAVRNAKGTATKASNVADLMGTGTLIGGLYTAHKLNTLGPALVVCLTYLAYMLMRDTFNAHAPLRDNVNRPEGALNATHYLIIGTVYGLLQLPAFLAEDTKPSHSATNLTFTEKQSVGQTLAAAFPYALSNTFP